MKLTRAPVVVWETSRDHAAATWTAATCGQVGVVESTSMRCQRINVGCAGRLAAITAIVVPADIISDKKDDVWFFSCEQGGRKEGNGNCEDSVHDGLPIKEGYLKSLTIHSGQFLWQHVAPNEYLLFCDRKDVFKIDPAIWFTARHVRYRRQQRRECVFLCQGFIGRSSRRKVSVYFLPTQYTALVERKMIRP